MCIRDSGNAVLQFIMCFFHCEILSKQRFFHEKKRLQNADAAVIFRGYLGRAGLWLFQIFALGLQNRPIGRYAPVSYTHLDVYKRQDYDNVEIMFMRVAVGAEAYILGQDVIFFGVFGVAVLDV